MPRDFIRCPSGESIHNPAERSNARSYRVPRVRERFSSSSLSLWTCPLAATTSRSMSCRRRVCDRIVPDCRRITRWRLSTIGPVAAHFEGLQGKPVEQGERHLGLEPLVGGSCPGQGLPEPDRSDGVAPRGVAEGCHDQVRPSVSPWLRRGTADCRRPPSCRCAVPV